MNNNEPHDHEMPDEEYLVASALALAMVLLIGVAIFV